jgi:hypothetical protein
MTNEQAAWLQAHPEHRPMGQTAGGVSYSGIGILHADGRFEPARRRVIQVSGAENRPLVSPLPGLPAGAFLVGKAQNRNLSAPEFTPLSERTEGKSRG